MEVPRNAFKQALREGRPQIGFWLSLGSPAMAEILAPLGYDWVLIDTEHAPNEVPAVIDQLRALEGGTASPVVRPAWNDLVLIKRLLDAGAQTLLVPFVRSAEEAARAVAATRYPPRGLRGVATIHRASRYGQVEGYLGKAEDELCVIVQLETRGSLGEPSHPEVQAAIQDAAARSARLGKPVGIFSPNEPEARRYVEMGFTFAAVGTDAALLRRGAEALLARFRGRG